MYVLTPEQKHTADVTRVEKKIDEHTVVQTVQEKSLADTLTAIKVSLTNLEAGQHKHKGRRR